MVNTLKLKGILKPRASDCLWIFFFFNYEFVVSSYASPICFPYMPFFFPSAFGSVLYCLDNETDVGEMVY